MTKRAKSKRAPILKQINIVAAGFTIIETMLFLAIAGLIFAGLVAGTNGAIRQQRYKDSVQGLVDDLRDLYSLAENPQVLEHGSATCETTNKSGRGRSDCSVYGIYAVISPNGDGRDNVEAYWLIGKDQAGITASSDLEFFEEVQPGTNVMVDGEITKLVARKHSLLWGADISIPCDSEFSRNSFSHMAKGCESGKGRSNNSNFIALVIYRSPITNALNTYSALIYDYGAANNDGTSGQLYQYVGDGSQLFKHQDVELCVSSGAGMSYGGGMRMIKIAATGSNTNAVRLIEADSEENKCND